MKNKMREGKDWRELLKEPTEPIKPLETLEDWENCMQELFEIRKNTKPTSMVTIWLGDGRYVTFDMLDYDSKELNEIIKDSPIGKMINEHFNGE